MHKNSTVFSPYCTTSLSSPFVHIAQWIRTEQFYALSPYIWSHLTPKSAQITPKTLT
nr:MAG TPA: hypothetical protein [Caudoviricetes sp.]